MEQFESYIHGKWKIIDLHHESSHLPINMHPIRTLIILQ